MYDQIREDTLFLMFYASVAMLALIACCYLLFRRSNAIAPDVTPPVRLRRWTAVFFAAIALCHLWYLPMYFLTSPDEVMLGSLIAGWLDCMTVIPLMIIILLTMLQDRRRPLWPVCVIMAPLVVGLAWYIVSRSDDFLLVLFVYFLLMWLGIIIYMVRAIRQYGRWLRDNYADLEHKEVWQGFVVLAIYLLVYAIYSLDATKNVSTLVGLPAKNIGLLLKQHCEEQQLYLQYDISLPQLAQTIGTNRLYLSQYFSSHGMTYNAYINGLRIQHFINLYHETVATRQPISVRQMAHQSGFRSYSTFNAAFKQNMGMTATEWKRNI